MSCVDVNHGVYHAFNETEPNFAKAVLSSASVPLAFPATVWEDRDIVCMDGGTAWNTNLVSAVERCREQVDSDSQITIDVIECSKISAIEKVKPHHNALDNFLRFRAIHKWAKGSNDIFEFMQAFPKVNFRHYIEPKENLAPGLDEAKFNNATMWPMQLKGREDGAKAV